jgi:hypothetical protein
MASVSEKVMNMVRDEISKNAKVTNQELFEKARKMDKEVAGLSSRQFNARYPLQVRRRAAGTKRRPGGRRAGRKSAAEKSRNEFRAILLQFGKAVAGAEKADMVEVVSGVDSYVDRLVKASGR